MMTRIHLAGLATALLVTAGSSQAAQAEPLRIGYFVWVGNGPFFVAQENGLFANEGIEVELINIEDHSAIFAALSARQIDAAQGAFQDPARFSEKGEEPWMCMLVIDESRGADGVIAVKDIQTIAELQGRTVAATQEGLPGFYLRLLLKDAGLSVADVEIIDLSSEDAAQAFLLQEVDAAVTYEPYLSEAKQAAHGHLLTDSSQQPGLIFDCLMTHESIVTARLEEFRALARAWDAAVTYIEANPEEANAIMARSLGGWLQDPALFADLVKGVRFYDLDANQAFFGTSEQPGPIYDSMQLALDALAEAGQLKTELTPMDVIGHHIVGEQRP
jgi:NitT/TauT family transport system substrate-binding protein